MTTTQPPARWPLHPAFVFALLFTALFALHAPLLRLPYFWDEAGYYVPAAHDIYLHGSLIPQDTVSNAHPPLVMAWLALWWKVSAFTPAVTRTAMLLVAAFALLGLFRLALIVQNTAVAIGTVLCTALYSVFFMQSSLGHVDVAAAGFTLWALSYYVEDRRWMCALMFSLAALSKETAIIAPVALAAWVVVANYLNLRAGLGVESKTAGKKILLLLFPVLPLALWYCYHYAKMGYVFGNPEYVRYNVSATLSPLRFVLALAQRTWQLLGHMNLFVLTLATAVAMLLPPQPNRNRIALPHQFIFYVVIATYVVALSVVGGALLTRYLLPVIPLVILLCVSTLWRRVRGWQIALLAVCGMFVASWFVAPPYRFAPEDNLAYRDYILLHVKAERLVEKRYPGARVLTAWPASDELTKAYLGYVAKPVPVVRIENFSLEQVQLAQQSASPYDVALLFSTKYETPRRLRWEWWERQQQRFFDFHEDLPPELAARMLGGQIVFSEQRAGEWIAVVDMRRTQNARLR